MASIYLLDTSSKSYQSGGWSQR